MLTWYTYFRLSIDHNVTCLSQTKCFRIYARYQKKTSRNRNKVWEKLLRIYLPSYKQKLFTIPPTLQWLYGAECCDDWWLMNWKWSGGEKGIMPKRDIILAFAWWVWCKPRKTLRDSKLNAFWIQVYMLLLHEPLIPSFEEPASSLPYSQEFTIKQHSEPDELCSNSVIF
jgi:hypothetical protein